MTNEEIIKGMLTITDDNIDPVFLTGVVDHLTALEPKGVLDTIVALRDAAIAAGDPGKLALQRLNLAMAKDKKFNDAMVRLHTWKDAQAQREEDGE